MIKRIAVFLFFISFFGGIVFAIYSFSKSQKIEIFFKGDDAKKINIDSVKNVVDSNIELTMEQKIGQLFIVSIKGKEVGPETEQFIKEYHPGGILLLSDNIGGEAQLKELIFSLQKIALNDTGIPLFIAVDQEGGVISRIKWIEKTPQAGINDTDSAYNIAKKRGEELSKVYITLNFAPVLDDAVSGDFVYDRIFKTNSGELAKSMINGYKDSKVLSCIKHFPGYVGISFNPEDKLAVIDKIPEISQFKKANEANPEFVMVSNVVYKELGNLPFSFLKSGIDLLKKEIPGNYLVISDDLSQYSLLNNFPLEEIVSKPINAGMDVLIFSNWRKDPKEGIDALKKAVEEKKVSEERINEALFKIIKLKNVFN